MNRVNEVAAEDKVKLRLVARKILVGEKVQKSESQTIVSLLQGRAELKAAHTVGLFYPFPSEPDLLRLFEIFPGKLAFPKVTNAGLKFFRASSARELTPGYHQIPEPSGTTEKLVSKWNLTDLILVPGLLFDREGGRIGSGKGFYDRYLQGLEIRPLFWGTCLSPFVASRALPQESNDVRLHGLAIASGIFTF